MPCRGLCMQDFLTPTCTSPLIKKESSLNPNTHAHAWQALAHPNAAAQAQARILTRTIDRLNSVCGFFRRSRGNSCINKHAKQWWISGLQATEAGWRTLPWSSSWLAPHLPCWRSSSGVACVVNYVGLCVHARLSVCLSCVCLSLCLSVRETNLGTHASIHLRPISLLPPPVSTFDSLRPLLRMISVA